MPELVRLYKSLVLSFIESGTPGYFHASDSVLATIDRVQKRFLREVGLSEVDALVRFRLAPLGVRRCIAMLGFLHRVTLGDVSTQILDMFPRLGPKACSSDDISSRVRGITALHDKQLVDRVSAGSSQQFKRSIFGMVQCYNALPQRLVDLKSIKSLQSALQKGIIHRAQLGHDGWQNTFVDGRKYASLLQFQRFFRI